MTRLFNRPSDFADEFLEGMAAAHPDQIRSVPGGAVRSTRSADGGVAVVIGGGSGHYPAFAGLVGQGLAHGAAMGNIFASPSARQIYDVARAAERGGGVVLAFGNYAGDVLHFGRAAERLRAEGVDARIVAVTDDVASAGADETAKRRGIAGGLAVYKVAGAAADAGYGLDDVVRVASRANDRTRTLGVAFAGCTLPGASEPLFTVAPGTMSIGLGIHGEPGISEQEIPSADGLARLLVERLLAERPEHSGPRVSVLLNGLGAVKQEELFVVYRRVALLLADAGLEVVAPEVGELCTSLDMAGASLTLFWLDEELEGLWTAPADAPAFRRGAPAAAEQLPQEPATPRAGAEEAEPVPRAGEGSRRSARRVMEALDAVARTLIDNAAELGRIDAVAGDGDHGLGMERGARAGVAAAAAALDAGAGAGTLLRRAAEAWADEGGGTSGALWGVALEAAADRFGDDEAVAAPTLAGAVAAAKDAVMRVGKASLGDKTMVDVFVPFSDRLSAEVSGGGSLGGAWALAAADARSAAQATAALTPKIGRARPLAAKSVGSPDAGAVSFALMADAVTGVLNAHP